MATYVIILNYNNKNDIVSCIKSLKKKKSVFKTLVVDNGSKDGSLQLIRKKFPKVEIIENKRNLGYAKGNNVGIRYALKKDAANIILLNPDVRVSTDFLEPLFKNSADIVGAIIKFKRNNNTVYDLGGYANLIYGRCFHRESEKVTKSVKHGPDYVSGACMLVKRHVFEKVGYFDERFFLYFEDSDFCIRAKSNGLKISLEQNSVVTHKLDSKKSFIKNYHLIISNFKFINKHVLFYFRPIGYLYLCGLTLKIIYNYINQHGIL